MGRRRKGTVWSLQQMRATIAALLVLSLFFCARADAVSYSATRIGDQCCGEGPHAINNRGDVVGAGAKLPGRATRTAFLWSDGVMADLGTLGGPTSVALGINDARQVVGSADLADGSRHAFLWEDGIMLDLGTLGGGHSAARAINDVGHVVGWSYTPAGKRAFLWTPAGGMVELPGTAALSSEAVAINSRGWIVGAEGNTAVVWKDGVPTRLGGRIAVDVNDEGFVLVDSIGSGLLFPPTGPYILLADLGAEGHPVAINSRNEIVFTGSSPGDDALYANGEVHLLHELMPEPNAPQYNMIFNGADINDAGQMVGSAPGWCVGFCAWRIVTATRTDRPPDPVCGNGIAESGEECDDGNAIDVDGCTNACRFASCDPGEICFWSDETVGEPAGSFLDWCPSDHPGSSCPDDDDYSNNTYELIETEEQLDDTITYVHNQTPGVLVLYDLPRQQEAGGCACFQPGAKANLQVFGDGFFDDRASSHRLYEVSAPLPECCRVSGGGGEVDPRYNEVRQKSAHNAYERDEALGDQLVYHRIRSLELDIHVDGNRKGIWRVSHDDSLFPHTSCYGLSSCLEELATFHRTNPNHEVITLFIEMKDGFDKRHTPKHLDGLLKILDKRQYVGAPAIFRPRDLCPASPTLQAARDTCGWPRLSELRGKFLIVINGPDAWQYVRTDEQAFDRTAFFMRDGDRAEADLPPPGAVLFFNFEQKEDWQVKMATVSGTKDVRRLWGVNDEAGWVAATQAGVGVHHIATDKVNAEDDPWASTANARGWPFMSLDGRSTSHLAEDTREISMLVDSGDIWDRADSFAFLPSYSDDSRSRWTASISTASSHVEHFAKGCLMARADWNPDAPYIAVCRPADNHRPRIQWRAEVGGESHVTELATNMIKPKHGNVPIHIEDVMHVRLKVDSYKTKADRTCATGYASRDAKRWWKIGKRVCVASRLAWQGLAASAHGNAFEETFADNAPVTFVFSNVTKDRVRSTLPYEIAASSTGVAAVGEAAAMDAVDGFLPGGHRVVTKGADPILWIHGLSAGPFGPSSNNLENTFREAIDHLRAEGWAGQHYVMSYYDEDVAWDDQDAADRNVATLDLTAGAPGTCAHEEHHASGHSTGSGCRTPRRHTRDTDIRHLAYHLAWEIHDRFTSQGQRVRIMAHSMGGLIARYALLQVQEGNSEFPESLDVATVETFGTPHEGGDLVSLCLLSPLGCAEFLPIQIEQMWNDIVFGKSSFLQELGSFVPTAGVVGHPRWWLYGAQDDDQVRIESALAPRGASTIEYDSGQGVEHSSYFSLPTKPYRCRINGSDWTSCSSPMHFAATYTLPQ